MSSGESMSSNESGPSPSAAARRADFQSVASAGRRCLACGVEPTEGQTLTAALIELPRAQSNGGGEFQRLDYCAACWPASPWSRGHGLLDEGQSAHPADAYGAEPVAVWTVRVGTRVKRKRTFVDDRVLMNFFLRLADDPQAERQQFRFVLMLILLRHRKLRHEQTERGAGGDAWLVRLSPAMAEATGTSPDLLHRVIDPRLDAGQVQQVAQQLSQILQEDIDAADEGGQA